MEKTENIKRTEKQIETEIQKFRDTKRQRKTESNRERQKDIEGAVEKKESGKLTERQCVVCLWGKMCFTDPIGAQKIPSYRNKTNHKH